MHTYLDKVLFGLAPVDSPLAIDDSDWDTGDTVVASLFGELKDLIFELVGLQKRGGLATQNRADQRRDITPAGEIWRKLAE